MVGRPSRRVLLADDEPAFRRLIVADGASESPAQRDFQIAVPTSAAGPIAGCGDNYP